MIISKKGYIKGEIIKDGGEFEVLEYIKRRGGRVKMSDLNKKFVNSSRKVHQLIHFDFIEKQYIDQLHEKYYIILKEKKQEKG